MLYEPSNLRLIRPPHLSSLHAKSLIESLGGFERSKVPLELKILAWPSTYSSQASGELPGPYPRSTGSRRQLSGSGLGSSAREYAWSLPRLGRDLVKVNGLEYRVYVAIDVDCSNNQIVVTFVTVRFEKMERILRILREVE
jgi:hypothetical protein